MEFSPEKYSHRCLCESVIGCQDSHKCSPNLGWGARQQGQSIVMIINSPTLSFSRCHIHTLFNPSYLIWKMHKQCIGLQIPPPLLCLARPWLSICQLFAYEQWANKNASHTIYTTMTSGTFCSRIIDWFPLHCKLAEVGMTMGSCVRK